mgnify:FL=1
MWETGYVPDPKLVCLEPPEATCRLTCPSGCETVDVCGRGDAQCDGPCPDALHCFYCGEPMLPLPAGDCHIVDWVDDVEDCYGGGERTFQIPVDIDWQEQGATWSLPDAPTATEVTP